VPTRISFTDLDALTALTETTPARLTAGHDGRDDGDGRPNEEMNDLLRSARSVSPDRWSGRSNSTARSYQE